MARRRALGGWTLLLAALALLRATPSRAHAVGVSRGEYRVEGAGIRADLVFARKELVTALPALDADRDGELAAGELARGRDVLAAWLRRGLTIAAPSAPCAGDVARAGLTEQDGVEVVADYRCPDGATAFTVRLGLLADLSLGHRHLLAATAAAETVRAVLYEAAPELTVAGPGAAARRVAGVGASLVRLGIAHILTGWDHLLFLLALLLVGGPLRAVLGVVTAFTLAHSVTLAVAALGLWAPRPTLVEPAIALSIAWVGIENCLAPRLRGRWRLTFLFGLVHGFGFAGALRDVALSARELPLALASFNVGVEAGQLAVLALVLPCVGWLGARAWLAPRAVRVASLAIATIGLWWFVERIATS